MLRLRRTPAPAAQHGVDTRDQLGGGGVHQHAVGARVEHADDRVRRDAGRRLGDQRHFVVGRAHLADRHRVGLSQHDDVGRAIGDDVEIWLQPLPERVGQRARPTENLDSPPSSQRPCPRSIQRRHDWLAGSLMPGLLERRQG